MRARFTHTNKTEMKKYRKIIHNYKKKTTKRIKKSGQVEIIFSVNENLSGRLNWKFGR